MTPVATYEELDDLPSLVNSLRECARLSRDDIEIVFLSNAATAIDGLIKDNTALTIDLERERYARRIVDQALADALQRIKAANDA